MTDVKICPLCKRELSSDSFGLDNATKDKLTCWCLECKRQKYKEYYIDNRDKVLQKNAKWFAENKERHKEYLSEWYKKNREAVLEKQGEYQKTKNDLLRIKIMTHLGGVRCVHCGEENFFVLAIDHINEDGYKDRNTRLKRFSYYKGILEMGVEEAKKKYQILCRNCNWMKRIIHLRGEDNID